MRAKFLAVAGAAVVVLAGAASEGADSAVTAQLFQFKPGTVSVAPGTRVVWTNRDDIVHTVTAGTPETPAAGFDATLEGQDASAGVRFTERGVFPYFCKRHPHMRGEIRVD